MQIATFWLVSSKSAEDSRDLITDPLYASFLKMHMNLLKVGILLALPYLPRLGWGIHSPFSFPCCNFSISFLFACAAASG